MTHPLRDINGQRPAPLKIHKHSHQIQKPPSSGEQPRNQPLIIYTRSPKIIHTHARDFMALVQRLTGLSSANPPPPPTDRLSDDVHETHECDRSDPSSSSLESSGTGEDVNASDTSGLVSPLEFERPPPNPLLSEIPLLTPKYSSDLFCSPRSFGYPESWMYSPQLINMAGSFSPSFLEALKAIPEF